MLRNMAIVQNAVLILFLVNSAKVAGDQTYTTRTQYGSVETLDQVSYIFPARGEFVYLKNENITVQIRTDYPSSDNHAAAYITALALKEDGNLFEVYRDTNSTMISVFKNSMYMCNTSRPFRPCSSLRTILAGKRGTDEIIAIKSKGIRSLSQILLKSKNGIEVELKVTTGNHSNVHGLAGGFVGDELFMGNGSTLPYNITVTTPRQLYSFGTSWRVRNTTESLFNYTTQGGNYTYYNTPIINPVFLDDLLGNLTALFNDDASHPHTSSEIVRFNTTCQGNSECLLAIARTNDIHSGRAIIDRIKKQELEQRIKDNVPPEFLPNFPVEITLVLGVVEVCTINLTKYARDNNTANQANLNYTVDTSLSSNQYSLEEGIFRWNITEQIRQLTEFRLQFKVLDEFLKSDESESITLIFCGCENSSQCDNSSRKIVVPDNENFKVMGCTCGKYASGRYCEIPVPVCDIEVCYGTCNDSVPHGTNPCAPCPSGYGGDGRACTDIDECAIGKCSQSCNNTIGSYTCSCYDGYTLDADNTTCDNIDECALQTDACKATMHELCKDTPGSFDCICEEGYTKNKAKTCQSGDFQYIGNISLIWQRAPYNKASVESFAVQTVSNVYNQSLERYNNSNANPTMKDIFNYVEVHNIILRSSFKTYLSELDVIFILHLAETVPTQWVDSFLKSPSIRDGAPFEFSGIHGTVEHIQIYADSNKSLCDIPGRTKCSIYSTNCVGKSGTYSCQCKTGFNRTESDSLYTCSDIDECKEPGYSFSNGNCVNTVGGWDCMCDTGYTANTMTDTTKTCIATWGPPTISVNLAITKYYTAATTNMVLERDLIREKTNFFREMNRRLENGSSKELSKLLLLLSALEN